MSNPKNNQDINLIKINLFFKKYSEIINFNNPKELYNFIIENEIKFEDEECGMVKFSRTKRGRKYLIPSQFEKTYIN